MTGNDLETSEIPLSVFFCIIEKNAFSDCKGNECFSIGKVVKDRMQDGSRRGLIRDSCDKYFWPLSYSSAKTAQKRMDKLEKAGIRCKLTGYNGGCIEFLGYTPKTEAQLEQERQDVIIAHQAWQKMQSLTI